MFRHSINRYTLNSNCSNQITKSFTPCHNITNRIPLRHRQPDTHFRYRYAHNSSDSASNANNNDIETNHNTPLTYSFISIPKNKSLYLINIYSSNPSIREYRHPRHLLSLNYWKQFIQQFIHGSKALIKNSIQARKLIKQYTNTNTNQIDFNKISRRDQRFIHTTKQDVLIGMLIDST